MDDVHFHGSFYLLHLSLHCLPPPPDQNKNIDSLAKHDWLPKLLNESHLFFGLHLSLSASFCTSASQDARVALKQPPPVTFTGRHRSSMTLRLRWSLPWQRSDKLPAIINLFWRILCKHYLYPYGPRGRSTMAWCPRKDHRLPSERKDSSTRWGDSEA